MSSVKVRHSLTRWVTVEDFLAPCDWQQLSPWKQGEGDVALRRSIFDQRSSGVYENADVAFTSAPSVWWGLRPLWGNDCSGLLFSPRTSSGTPAVVTEWNWADPSGWFAALTLSPQQFARSARPKQDGPDTKRGAKRWPRQQVSIHSAGQNEHWFLS